MVDNWLLVARRIKPIHWKRSVWLILITGLLGLSSLLALLLLFFLASFDASRNLSPQGCRMSWMSPPYVLQTSFNTTWSPLARRYTLWLYREVGWVLTIFDLILTLLVGSWWERRQFTDPLPTRQCWISPSGSLIRVFGYETTLFFSLCRFWCLWVAQCETVRRLYRCVDCVFARNSPQIKCYVSRQLSLMKICQPFMARH